MRIIITVRAIIILINDYGNSVSTNLKSCPPNPHIQSLMET